MKVAVLIIAIRLMRGYSATKLDASAAVLPKPL